MVVAVSDVKRGLEFFAQSFVGETVAELVSVAGGVYIKMESGLRVKIQRSYSTDIIKEKIVGFQFQFPENLNVITLNLESGRRVVILA